MSTPAPTRIASIASTSATRAVRARRAPGSSNSDIDRSTPIASGATVPPAACHRASAGATVMLRPHMPQKREAVGISPAQFGQRIPAPSYQEPPSGALPPPCYDAGT